MRDESDKYRIKDAQFLRGSPSLDSLGATELPEIALIGRSNAGKSTLLNRLTHRKGLARTSSTPGRTQEINLFDVSLLTPDTRSANVILADLPGYGFSKFAKSKRSDMSRLVVDYICTRESLKIVCILNDCRRPPEEDEHSVQKLAFESDVGVLVLLTKCDKLTKNELRKQVATIAKAFHLEPADIVCTGTSFSVDAVWERILIER